MDWPDESKESELPVLFMVLVDILLLIPATVPADR